MVMAKEWNPDSIRAALDLELHPVEGEKTLSPEKLAEKKFNDAAPLAADALIHLALYSDNEQMRYRAATYINDRVLGKSTTESANAVREAKTGLEALTSVVQVESNNN